MKRQIILIDEEKCDGCGLCVPDCPEGALQTIDGKARLISDLLCDGLGACIGECPRGAITIEEREAEPYDERAVMQQIIAQGENVIRAHLDHLREHGQQEYLQQAMEMLKEKGIQLAPSPAINAEKVTGGCPGAWMLAFRSESSDLRESTASSELRQWRTHLHLVSPRAPYYSQGGCSASGTLRRVCDG